MLLYLSRKPRGPRAGATSASVALWRLEAALSDALNQKQRRSASCCARDGRVGDQKGYAHPSHSDIYRFLLRPHLPYVGRGWDRCLFALDFFLSSVGLQILLYLRRKPRGPRAGASSASIALWRLEAALSNAPHLATPRVGALSASDALTTREGILRRT